MGIKFRKMLYRVHKSRLAEENAKITNFEILNRCVCVICVEGVLVNMSLDPQLHRAIISIT